MASILDRERAVAPLDYNRWLVPPAALCVHLCIGQAYAFSVFNLPMTKLVGLTDPAPEDWTIPALGWIFSIAIVFLGLAAAFTGTWLDRVGLRKAMFTAACCFGGGFLVSVIGVATHQLWIVYLGYDPYHPADRGTQVGCRQQRVAGRPLDHARRSATAVRYEAGGTVEIGALPASG